MARTKYRFTIKRPGKGTKTISVFGKTYEQALSRARREIRSGESVVEGSGQRGTLKSVRGTTSSGGRVKKTGYQYEGDPEFSFSKELSDEYGGITPVDKFSTPSAPSAPSTTPEGVITANVTGNQYIMGTNGSYIPYLPKTTAPTNAGQVGSGMGTTGLPSTSPTFGNTEGAAAANAGISAALETQMKAYEKQLASAEREQEKTSKSLLSFLSNSPSQTDIRADAYKDTGIDPSQYFADQKKRIAEIDSLTQAYNAQVAARDAAIAQSYDKLASNSFINNQIGQIERNAAPRLNQMSANINSKAAVLQALQGNFAEARSFVNQAVEDAVADRKFKLDLFTTMYQMNEDKINRLDDKYQTAFKYSMDIAQREYDAAREEKMAVGELMLKYYESGITINDTLDEALAKAVASGADPQTAFQNALDAQQEARLGSEGSTPGSTSSVSTYAQAYLDGQIELTSVPEKLRAQVIAEANRIAEEALNAPLPAPTQPRRSTLSYLPGAVLETLQGTSQNFFSNLFGN